MTTDPQSRIEELDTLLDEWTFTSSLNPSADLLAITRGFSVLASELAEKLADAQELLAVVHGDGGHHVEQNGWQVSCRAAATRVHADRCELDAERSAHASTKRELEREREGRELIADIIEIVDNRCLAVDGPVARFQDEVTDSELRRIYQLAKGTQGTGRKAKAAT